MRGIDSYKFGSDHLFGKNNRLEKLRKNTVFHQDVYQKNVVNASSNMSKSTFQNNDDFGLMDNDIGQIDFGK